MSLDTSRYPLGFKSTVPGSTDDLVSLSLTHHSSTPAPIFVLTLLSAQTPDNRLTPQFLTALHSALKHVEEVWDNVLSSTPHGAGLVITGTLQGKTAKFFSNGLDFESAIGDPEFFDRYLFPVYESLLTFPVPVVASIGGHAFAAGFGLAAACDGAVMGKKGYLCMNEVRREAYIDQAKTESQRLKADIVLSRIWAAIRSTLVPKSRQVSGLPFPPVSTSRSTRPASCYRANVSPALKHLRLASSTSTCRMRSLTTY